MKKKKITSTFDELTNFQKPLKPCADEKWTNTEAFASYKKVHNNPQCLQDWEFI